MYEGKAVEGLNVMLSITNGLVADHFEDYMNSKMYMYPDEVVLAAMDLRGEWACNSNSQISLAMEKYAAEILGVVHRHYNNVCTTTIELSEVQKEAVKAIHEVTQEHLLKKELPHVTVYRGLGWDERPSWVNKDLKLGDFIGIEEDRTLSSWSFSKAIAQGFINQSDFGFVVKAKMPVKCIFAIIDIVMEAESVCIRYDEAVRFEVVCIKGGNQNEEQF